MAKAVDIARKHGLTVYDSCHLNFAREAGGHITTADKRIYRKYRIFQVSSMSAITDRKNQA